MVNIFSKLITNYLKWLFVLYPVAFLMYSCNHEEEVNKNEYLDKPLCGGIFHPKQIDYKVVGFYPSYRHETLPVSSIQWDKITRIVYAFAIPNADGTLNTGSLSMVDNLVEAGHSKGVEVYFSVGGGDGSVNYPELATNETSRNRFVNEIREYVFQHCLDGVDIDWEYWSGSATSTIFPDESNALVSILKDLQKELSPFNLGISIDLSATDWGGKHFMDEIPDYVNDLQVMSYDFTGPWSAPGPHSAFDDAIGSGSENTSTGLAYWVNYRMWPQNHVLLGVPFYGRDFDLNGGEGISYSDILMLHPEAWQYDQVENIYYDGINTMMQKTQYVIDHQYAGIMIWELAQDSSVDSISLLSTIDRVINP